MSIRVSLGSLRAWRSQASLNVSMVTEHPKCSRDQHRSCISLYGLPLTCTRHCYHRLLWKSRGRRQMLFVSYRNRVRHIVRRVCGAREISQSCGWHTGYCPRFWAPCRRAEPFTGTVSPVSLSFTFLALPSLRVWTQKSSLPGLPSRKPHNCFVFLAGDNDTFCSFLHCVPILSLLACRKMQCSLSMLTEFQTFKMSSPKPSPSSRLCI